MYLSQWCCHHHHELCALKCNCRVKSGTRKRGKKNRPFAFDFPGSFFSLTYAFWRWDQFRVRANVTLRTTCRSRHKYRMCDQKFYISQQNGLSITKHCALVFQTSMNILLVCGFFFSFSLFLFRCSTLAGNARNMMLIFSFEIESKPLISLIIFMSKHLFLLRKKNTNRQENKLLAYLYGWI